MTDYTDLVKRIKIDGKMFADDAPLTPKGAEKHNKLMKEAVAAITELQAQSTQVQRVIAMPDIDELARAIYGATWSWGRHNWEEHWADREFDKADKTVAYKQAESVLAVIEGGTKGGKLQPEKMTGY